MQGRESAASRNKPKYILFGKSITNISSMANTLTIKTRTCFCKNPPDLTNLWIIHVPHKTIFSGIQYEVPSKKFPTIFIFFNV